MWHLKGKPFAVQARALEKADGDPAHGLWLEMGLGKTAVALNTFVDGVIRDDLLFHLIVCPDTLKSNWQIEAENFGVDMPFHIWPFNIDPAKLKPPAQIAMNYEALLYGGGKWLDKFRTRYDGRFMVTADESSRFKNHKSSTAKYMIALAPYAKVVRELTGTPMTQNVMDYWPQLRFIRRLGGINPYQFRNTYAVMGGYLGKQVVGIRNEDRLLEILDEATFRAYKSDWTDLPPKVFPPPRIVELLKRQRELYKEMEDDLMVMLDDEAVTAPMVITCLEKLQQISSGFIIHDDGETTTNLIDVGHNPKAREIVNICEEAGGKVLVFCRHRHAVGILMTVLQDFRPAVMRGGMSRQELDHQKLRFNSDHSCRVLIAQSSVGGMGHTLLGSGPGANRCSLVVFFENSFSLGDRLQSEDRPHRHGQDAESLTILDVICSKVEAKTVKALQKKLNLVEALKGRS